MGALAVASSYFTMGSCVSFDIQSVLASLEAENAKNKPISLSQVKHNPDCCELGPLATKFTVENISLQKRCRSLFLRIQSRLNQLDLILRKPKPLHSNETVVIIAVPQLSSNDAVSNDVFVMRDRLRKRGVLTHIYAEFWDKGLEHERIDERTFIGMLQSPRSCLIYNHCVYWPKGATHINSAQGAIYFRYHNVTPPEFFAPYDPISAFATEKGREQTIDLVQKSKTKWTRYLPASEFNAQELIQLGVERSKITIIPPFHRLNDFANCPENENLRKHLQDGKTNILFVGRVVPNKGFVDIIHTMNIYRERYGSKFRLIFAGTLSANLKAYYAELLSLLKTYGFAENVEWVSKTNFSDLHTYYFHSHVFLLLSEHEGFCLPILEAQSHRLPIVAANRTAIGHTLGEGQLCLAKPDHGFIACAIHRVCQDKELRTQIQAAGERNLHRFDLDTLTNTLIHTLLRDQQRG